MGKEDLSVRMLSLGNRECPPSEQEKEQRLGKVHATT